ncbi:MAG: ubiquitin-like small modifier protein 1 [bacterium]
MLLALPLAQAQDKKEPAFKLIQFQMALLKRGPQWTGESNTRTKKLETDQRRYTTSLFETGKAVITGRFDDDSDIRGLYILRTTSAEQAKAWAEDSPVVKSGHLVAEMHPWWSEDVMKKTATSDKSTRAYLAFLYRGDKWTPEKTPATEELQRAHLANIVRLAELKKLVVAGPFGDDTPLRGIFVFRVASIDEARELAATDPAVKAGRLKLDIHPWIVPEGFCPKPGSYARSANRCSSLKIMITVNVAGFLTDFANGESRIVLDSEPATVGQALESLWRKHVGLRDRVVNEQGQLRPHVNIFLNDENVRHKEMLDTRLPDTCEITILPAVSGGAYE